MGRRLAIPNGGFLASQKRWRRLLGANPFPPIAAVYGADADSWQRQYLRILSLFEAEYGSGGVCAIGRCPAQMNMMGMHLDYGGMPSIRLAIEGLETITIARPHHDGRVRIRSVVESGGANPEFPSAQFDLKQCLPSDRVASPERFKRYAVDVCNARHSRAHATRWEQLPLGVLIFLESYFRDTQPVEGLDLLVWSNIPPVGGMSSSSALVVSIAIACMAAYDRDPWLELGRGALLEGIGLSEWICGTRGGTADHGAMFYAERDSLVRVGALPTRNLGLAPMPPDYAAVVFHSGVERVYDNVRQQETAAAYPLSLFLIRHLILPRLQNDPAFSELPLNAPRAIDNLGDLVAGLRLEAIYAMLRRIPRETTLGQIEGWACEAGVYSAFHNFVDEEIRSPYPELGGDTPLYLRRRALFGMAENDRVIKSFALLRQGEINQVLDFIRRSHRGEGDDDLTNEEIEELIVLSRRGSAASHLCYRLGGYGRMTPEYDRVTVGANEFLNRFGGDNAGAVQRLGAGWGGSIGGLVQRSAVAGLRGYLEEEAGLPIPASGLIIVPGPGASAMCPSAVQALERDNEKA